jgi:hypothetical protein
MSNVVVDRQLVRDDNLQKMSATAIHVAVY